MRNLIIVLLAGLLLSACASKKQAQTALEEEQGVRFSIYVVQEYCGGAPPSEEILDQLQQPKPYSDTLFVHPQRDAFRDSLRYTIILNKGEAVVPHIAPGKYVVFNQAKMDAVENPEMDEMSRCRIMTSNMPFFSFTMEEKTTLVTDTVPLMCDPCIPPMP